MKKIALIAMLLVTVLVAAPVLAFNGTVVGGVANISGAGVLTGAESYAGGIANSNSTAFSISGTYVTTEAFASTCSTCGGAYANGSTFTISGGYVDVDGSGQAAYETSGFGGSGAFAVKGYFVGGIADFNL